MASPSEGLGSSIRALLVDDYSIIRNGLRTLFEGTDIVVVAEAASGREALEAVALHRPEVVFMDVRMPDMDGLAATKLIKEQYPQTAVIILTSFENTEYLRQAIANGAAGYLLKGASQTQLIDGARLVVEGSNLFDGRVLAAMLSDDGFVRALAGNRLPPSVEPLNERERAALALVAQGKTNKEIADALGYSVGTIKNTVQDVIEKLHVSDRTQAAVAAVRWHLVDV